MRRWINVKLVRIAERIMRRIADDKIHLESTRKMARDAAFDIGTIDRIISNPFRGPG